jgi:hypothetical protein
MANFTDYAEAKIINVWLRVEAAYKPAAIYVGLWTTTLVDASTGSSGTEVSGGSYARVQMTQADATWDAPTTGGDTENTSSIDFPTATAAWGTVTDVGICDASSAGNMLFYKALDTSKVVGDGDTISFVAGALDIVIA